MSYATQLKKHLAEYKRQVLGIEANGKWTRNGRAYEHILPQERWQENIDERIRSACLEYLEQRRVRRHRDFHHLNSSQAFALNLFFPLLAGEKPATEALAAALGFRGHNVRGWDFEARPDLQEGTNVDLHLALDNGVELFIEVKLTETEFGRVTASDRHIHKRDSTYAPNLRGKVVDEILSGGQFFQYYQLLRNLSYAGIPDKQLILFVPRENIAVAEAAGKFVSDVVLSSARDYVHVVFAEDFLAQIQADARLPEDVAMSVQAVAEKYALSKTSSDAV